MLPRPATDTHVKQLTTILLTATYTVNLISHYFRAFYVGGCLGIS